MKEHSYIHVHTNDYIIYTININKIVYWGKIINVASTINRSEV